MTSIALLVVLVEPVFCSDAAKACYSLLKRKLLLTPIILVIE
jgi:hypothetical protein